MSNGLCPLRRGSCYKHLLPLGGFSVLYSFNFMVVQVPGSHSLTLVSKCLNQCSERQQYLYFFCLNFFSSFLNSTLFIVKAHECIGLVGDILLSLVHSFMNEIYITVIKFALKRKVDPESSDYLMKSRYMCLKLKEILSGKNKSRLKLVMWEKLNPFHWAWRSSR